MRLLSRVSYRIFSLGGGGGGVVCGLTGMGEYTCLCVG